MEKRGERWRDIKGLEGKYHISNYGRVRCCGYFILLKRKYYTFSKLIPSHIMKLYNSNGYMRVELGKGNSFSIHRLVAQAFIPNPDNKPQVNHIDGNRSNNNVRNLEWVDSSENIWHAVNILKRKLGYYTKVKNLDTEIIFDTIQEANQSIGFDIKNSNIIAVCQGKRKTAGGYRWKYASKPRK